MLCNLSGVFDLLMLCRSHLLHRFDQVLKQLDFSADGLAVIRRDELLELAHIGWMQAQLWTQAFLSSTPQL